MSSEKRIATPPETAKYLRRGLNTLYIDVRAGRIPHYRVGTSIRFDLDEIDRWLESNRRGPEVVAR